MKQWKKNEFIRIIIANGFILDRYSGSHSVFKHNDGRVISIPRSMNPCIIQRLCKENNLKINNL
jgi:predicted RNA binding protein YcfA (HicA-like mRNA interferase family)